MYRRLNRFDFAIIGGVEKLIYKKEPSQEICYLCTTEKYCNDKKYNVVA